MGAECGHGGEQKYKREWRWTQRNNLKFTSQHVHGKPGNECVRITVVYTSSFLLAAQKTCATGLIEMFGHRAILHAATRAPHPVDTKNA